jgi:peroxiredoxin
MPHLKELHERYKDQGLVIVGLHTTNQGEKMADFVKEQALPWPVAVDIGNKTTSAFKVDSYPDYYLIDRAGRLRVADLQNSDLERAIKILLAEKPPPK